MVWVSGDGSLVAGVLASGPGGNQTYLFQVHPDGPVTGISRPAGGSGIAASETEILRASEGSIDNLDFRLELYPLDRPGPIGPSYPMPGCEVVQGYTPHISAGRYLILRSNCLAVPERATVAERWELHDRLEPVGSRYVIQAPQFSGYGEERTAHADGRGGVFWVGTRNTSDGWEVFAAHWDGDSEPTYTEPLVATGTTTEYAFGRPYPGGRFLAATNHRTPEGLHTTVALVATNPETGAAEIQWRWESSGPYYSGPFRPAVDVVGDEDVAVLLAAVFLQRVGPDGRSIWPTPREVYRNNESLRLIGYDAGVAITGHRDGSAHLLWGDQSGGVRLMRVDDEGAPSWDSPIYMGRSLHLQGKAVSDGMGGVWVLLNDRFGTIQHVAADGWRLYRRWFVPGCGRVSGFFARPSPDAEPVTYFGSDPLFSN